MYPEGQTGLPAERPRGGFEGPPTPERPRAVIFEPHPAVRAVLEYLLARDGYSVESSGALAREGPALMLVAAGDGLYVFESRDAAETLEALDPRVASSFETLCGVTGIQAFVPKPFGAGDVVRVVRVVRGFDARRRPRSRTA